MNVLDDLYHVLFDFFFLELRHFSLAPSKDTAEAFLRTHNMAESTKCEHSYDKSYHDCARDYKSEFLEESEITEE